MRAVLLLVVACGACSAPARTYPPRPTTGAIAGLVHDHDSGDAIEQAIITVGGREVTSTATGAYQVDRLAPGTYELKATFAGQPLAVDHVTVRAAETTVVDLTFTLGRPDPIHSDYAVLTASDRYSPKDLAATVTRIEGTVNDAATHERIVGAVVTAVGPGTGASAQTLQTVSDDQGRYRFDAAPPGVYVVSTYYSVGGHAQIEVRRSDIDTLGGQVVVVPLWIEAQK